MGESYPQVEPVAFDSIVVGRRPGADLFVIALMDRRRCVGLLTADRATVSHLMLELSHALGT